MVAEFSRKRRVCNSPVTIPLEDKLRIRTLYVQSGQAPSIIAQGLGMDIRRVNNVIHREGWTKERQAIIGKLEKSADAKAQASMNEIVEAVAQKTEELSVRSLNLCDELLTAKDPKGLQLASAAAFNFVKMTRLCRRMDQSALEAGASPSVILLRCDVAMPAKAEKNVTPSATVDLQ